MKNNNLKKLEEIFDKGLDKLEVQDFTYNKKNKKLELCGIKGFEDAENGSLINSLIIAHLWLIRLVEKEKNENFVYEILKYAKDNKTNLFEWSITDSIEHELNEILKPYNLKFEKYITDKLNVYNYSKEFEKAREKDSFIHTVLRYLWLAGLENNGKELEKIKLGKEFETFTSIINAIYIAKSYLGEFYKYIEEIPNHIAQILYEKSLCNIKKSEQLYYPKNFNQIDQVTKIIKFFSDNWLTFTKEEQVIIAKLSYSLKIFKELSQSILALNGIISNIIVRILFDNYWQSLYLIKNNEINSYNNETLSRLRLHILKKKNRSELDDEEMDILYQAANYKILDPIPLNADYFKKSTRDICIELNLKDLYDKYYEYTSEFIHASMSAIYSSLFVRCENPEHPNHLTLNPYSNTVNNCLPEIYDLLNMHIELVNDFINEKIFIDKIKFEDHITNSHKEFLDNMKKMNV